MKSHVFIDSNIWIYLFVGDSKDKYLKVKSLLKKCSMENTMVISFQVINEVTYSLKKKKFSEDKIKSVIMSMEESCIVVDFSLDLLLKASELREKHLFSFWDSLIIASSITANCITLYSEDMQDSRVIDGVTINNPLK